MLKVCRSSTFYVTWFLISALLALGGSGMELFSGLGGVTAANALRAVTNVLVGLSLLLADFKFSLFLLLLSFASFTNAGYIIISCGCTGICCKCN